MSEFYGFFLLTFAVIIGIAVRALARGEDRLWAIGTLAVTVPALAFFVALPWLV